MKRVKVRTDSGVVTELVFYNVSDRADVKKAKPPRPRFKDEDERAAFNLAIAGRRHAQIVNANFGPTSLYSTLTFSNEYEVHTFEEAGKIRDNFIRRIQCRCPKAKIMIYMGRGKSTHRIHFHMVSEGVPEALIRKLWYLGEVKRIKHLRAVQKQNRPIRAGGADSDQRRTGTAGRFL